VNTRSILLAVIVVVVLARAAAAAPDAGCVGTGTSLYFGNGINKTYDEAWEVADDDLLGLAAEAKVNDVVEIGVAYNHTDGFLEDVIQTLEQKEEEDPRFGWFLLNNITGYLLRGLNVVGILQLPAGAATLIATLQTVINQGLADSDSQPGTFYDSDVADQVSAYDEDLSVNGYRVIVVAHSQGTLYANASRAALAASDSTVLGSFGIVAVGDAAEVSFNGYVTSDDDLVIGALRTLGRTVLPANVHVPVSDSDFTGHGFEEVYISAQLPARPKVVALLSTLGGGLPYPAPNADSCGPPSGCAFNGGSATALYSGTIVPGDTQAYPLELSAGQGVGVRVAEVGTGSFTPAFKVYDPTGAKVVNGASGANVASDFFAAQRTGTYTVVVYDGSSSLTSAGAYNLYLMVAPGADACGSLTPGDVVSGQLAEGALDSYTFSAQAGQGVGIRVTDVDGTNLIPAFIVYDPVGAIVVNGAFGADVASDFIPARMSGTYTVVVYDESVGNASTGPYNLYFTLAPGANKGGALNPGDVVSGQLAEGALDSYTFSAAMGDGVALTVTATRLDGAASSIQIPVSVVP